MRRKKGLPGCSRPFTPRRGFNTVVIEDTLYRIPVHGNPEIVQGIPDPGVIPRLVFVSDFYDKISYSISRPRSPGASPGSSIVFICHKASEPAQKGIRRYNRSELLEGFPSESSCLDSQSAPLLVRESEPMTFAEFLVHPDLFDEIINDLLLILR